MIRSRQSAAALLRRFEEAHEGLLFRGCGDPDERDLKVQRYHEARERIIKHLMGDDA